MDAPSPHVNLVVLRSADLDRAAEFYREMGLLFTRHSHGNGPEHYTSEVSGVVFELYPLTPKSQPTTGTRIGFRVDSVDGVVEILAKIGVEIVTAPADSEWGRRAVVKDFDGHIVELLAMDENFLKTGSVANESSWRWTFSYSLLAVAVLVAMGLPLSVPHFAKIFRDMIGDHPLPMGTTLVLRFYPFLVVYDALVAVGAIYMAWRSRIQSPSARYLYGFFVAVLFPALFVAYFLLAPLMMIMRALGGTH